jgi:multidrug efflux pump
LDIRVRFPFAARHLDQLDGLRVPTRYGLVPISSFVTFAAASKVGSLTRTDAHRVLTIEADVADGLLVNDQMREIRAWLPEAALDSRVKVRFKGQDEDQREAQAFLVQAFATALFLMAIILVTQFNRFYQTFLVMSAVVFSTAGVLIGLLVTGSPFGVVMGGIGVIALAGIIVNNNIVLIDTYNELRAQALPPVEAVLRTGAQRLRPVLLTTVTTILGLVPMVFGVNIDLIARDITMGAPSTQLWSQLASAIAGGLVFATPLTLILTPCLLILGERVATAYRHRRGQTDVLATATGGDESSREKERVTELACRGGRHLLVTLRPEPGPDTEGIP